MSQATHVDILLAGIRDTSDRVLNGGKVYSYEAGTTTSKALYSAQDKSAVASNPVTLDSNGKALVYADGSYKFIITTSAGATVYTHDNLTFGLPDDSTIWGGTTTGSADVYAMSPSPAIAELVNGQTFSAIANFTNSGASTLNISSLGAVDIKRGSGADLSGGDITVNEVFSVIYQSSGPKFTLVSASSSPTYTGVTISGLTANKVLCSDASKAISSDPSGLSPTFTGLTLSGLTASKLLCSDGSKAVSSDPTSLSPTLTGLTLSGLTASKVLCSNGGKAVSSDPSGLSPTFTGATFSGLTASKILLTGSSKELVSSTLAEANIATSGANSNITGLSGITVTSWTPEVKGAGIGGAGYYSIYGDYVIFNFHGTVTYSGGGMTYALPLQADATYPAQSAIGFGCIGQLGVHGLLNAAMTYCDLVGADGSTLVAGGPSVISMWGIYRKA